MAEKIVLGEEQSNLGGKKILRHLQTELPEGHWGGDEISNYNEHPLSTSVPV